MPACAWRLLAHCCTARGAALLRWQSMQAWLSLEVVSAARFATPADSWAEAEEPTSRKAQRNRAASLVCMNYSCLGKPAGDVVDCRPRSLAAQGISNQQKHRVWIDVAKSASHQLSRNEIASDNPCGC